MPHALRGATAIQAAVARVLGRTVSVSEPPILPVGIALGPLILLHLQDPERGWWVAGSGADAATAPAGLGVAGRRSRIDGSGRRAVEMVRAEG